MLFKAEITVPVNTPADILRGRPTYATPVVLAVYPGTVTRVWFGFPKGCFGLAHLQVRHWGWQAWPWTPLQSFHWNDYMFTFEDHYPLTTEPHEFVLWGWSYDDFYEHTLTFMCFVEPALPEPSQAQIKQVYEDLGVPLGGY